MAELRNSKPSRCTNPSRKVRVIGKIRGLADKESESIREDSKPWITVKKAEGNGVSETSTLFFDSESTSRRDGFELDYCYEQHEEIDQVYSREIQPLISEVFDGRNASIIAIGARGSGKTHTIQGSQEKPGLAVIAMSDILSKANELGKSVSVSLYELTQEHVKDLLNPSRPAIQVLEDGQGKVNLKGLSQVPVKCVTKFHNIYFGQTSSQSTQKKQVDQPSNKGLMVHISSEDENLKPKMSNKINFVDLAGYEDPRKSCKDGITPAESSNRNKLLYTLLNVVSAINSNETRIPYRESKFTRMLQDSLGGTSRVLLLTCLNPYFCQDSLSFMNLISRSCRSTKQVLTDSTNRSQRKIVPASLSAKKQIDSNRRLSTKKDSCILKGRKLFEEQKTTNTKQSRCRSQDTSTQKSKFRPNLKLAVAPFSLEEAPLDNPISDCSPKVEPIEELRGQSQDTSAEKSKTPLNLELVVAPFSLEEAPLENFISDCTPKVEPATEPMGASSSEESNPLDKKDDASPPLSERIREISNNLKSLCASTPKMPEEVVVEPKTPNVELSGARFCSPRGTVTNYNSGLKHSFVQEYLNFLNSANKEELKSLKGIGDKRAQYILELREESPEPFKNLDDLQEIGLSAKQVTGIMKQVASGLFN